MSEFENDFGEDGDEPEWITLDGRIKVVTQMAIGIELSSGTELLWLPKSQIEGLNDKLLEDTPYGFAFVSGLPVRSVMLPAWLGSRDTRLM